MHAAAGGEKRHQPSDFLRIAQTQELIAELSSEDSRNIQTKTVVGKGKQQGTYVCRELVYAYANWISPAFYLKMIRAFDALQKAPGNAALPAPAAISKELRNHILTTAHRIALNQYGAIGAILTECVTDNLACGATQDACFGYVDAYAQTADGTVLVNVRDLHDLVSVCSEVIDKAGTAISAVKRIEQRCGFKLYYRAAKKYTKPGFHKHDRLIEEVIDRIAD